MEERKPDAAQVLTALERHLDELERRGVQWLSIAPDPSWPAPAPGPASEPASGVASADATSATMAPSIAQPSIAQPPTPAEVAPSPRGPEPELTPSAEGGLPHPGTLPTLEALRQAYANCQNCKLGATRTHLVFGVGAERPRLLFVGEGPGADEDAQGEPFVGRAGALLTGLIQAMGLVREDVYIANVVKCRPPNNRNPEPDEIASCRPILQRQIELLQPALIVTLGNVPLKLLKPHASGITRERGVPFPYQQWTVLPTFHPSYLLRSPAAIETCWSDFRKALQMAYAPR